MKNTSRTLKKALQIAASLATIIALAFSLSPALAKGAKNTAGTPQDITFDGINFGNDSSQWSNDNECDDPRFIGPATAVDMEDADIGRDATDCMTLYKGGEISLKPDPADIVNTIDFGDNTSEWANDNECDDPRFGGAGVDELLLDEDMGRDAADCRSLFLSGEVHYLGDDINMQIIEFDGIVFGDNTSEWKSDGECDDPRFRGQGMATQLVEADNGRDAVDCLALYQDGSITLIGNTTPTTSGTIDFGDDSSQWANDNECDDPRFAGEGVAGILLDADLGSDATDCRTLFEAGKIYLAAASNNANSGIDFGNDSNQYANDGECDDPRFAGPGVADVLLDEDLGSDATDCRNLFESGQIYLTNSANGTPPVSATEYGDNSSEWANDGECDDPRFIGQGMASQLMAIDIGRDANDCRTLVGSSQIALISVTNLDFGDDSSQWSNDGECDDPRFAGDGVATKLDPINFGRDATDCKALLNAGSIQFIGGILTLTNQQGAAGSSTPSTQQQNSSTINWGDDSSQWAQNGECDDPRFSGPGVADILQDVDLERDATDCQTLFEAGQIQLTPPSSLKGFHNEGFNFGDNTSDYANNDICDDPRFIGPGTDEVLLAEDEGRDANDCKALFRVGQVSLASDLTIDFGSNQSQWANDNECDDPRFAGKAMAADLDSSNILQDAADCQASFEMGRIYLIEHGAIDFGDDSSEWNKDNECDDPRFAGPGSAANPSEENLLKDATDCRALYRSSQVYLLPPEGAAPINFGDNASTWADDGECDDPRFSGPGSATELVDEDLGHDALDCQTLLNAGQIQFGVPLVTSKPKGPDSSTFSDIDFGNDSSEWANDGECDDPRFSGPGVADVLLDEDMGRDATDCSALLASGQLEFIGDAPPQDPALSSIDFGDDSSNWANDGECDDPRFSGPGAAEFLIDEDLGRDATDCSTLLASGQLEFIGDAPPQDPALSSIDFGDDSSSWANNDSCDDPRFEGEGTAPPLLAEDLGRDATDCQALFNQGMVQLIEQTQTSGDTGPATPVDPVNIDFGDNSSLFADDSECDDPRFEGPGMAPAPQFEGDRNSDANDCQALFNAGQVVLRQ